MQRGEGARRRRCCSAIEKGDAEHLAVLRQSHETRDPASSPATFASCSGRRPRRRPRRCSPAGRRSGSGTATTSGSSAISDGEIDALQVGRPRPPGADRGDVRRRLRRARRGAHARSSAREAYRKETSVGGLMEFAGEAVVSVVGGELGKTLPLNKNENAELNIFLPTADAFGLVATIMKIAAPILGLIPQFGAAAKPIGVGAEVGFGGVQLSKVAELRQPTAPRWSPNAFKGSAERASKMAGYYRRAEDYVLQANLATSELEQYGRQIVVVAAARAGRSSASTRTSSRQIENAEAVEAFLGEKFTDRGAVHAGCTASSRRPTTSSTSSRSTWPSGPSRRSSYELMRPEFDELQIIKFGYWDAGRKGLLAGEQLCLDLAGWSSPTSSRTGASTS